MFITKRIGRNLAQTLIIIALLLSCAFCSCGGTEDWLYLLPNDYAIVHVNSGCIIFGKHQDYAVATVVDNYILEFCYNSTWIGLKRLPVSEDQMHFYEEVNAMDQSTAEYYIVDAEADTIYGPYTIAEYNEYIDSFEIIDMCDWIETVPAPPGSDFGW
jgi:hypothetical protein